MNWVVVTVLLGSRLLNASCPDGLTDQASRIWSIHNGKVELHFVIWSQHIQTLNWKVEVVKVAAGNMSAKVRWEETALPSQYL